MQSALNVNVRMLMNHTYQAMQAAVASIDRPSTQIRDDPQMEVAPHHYSHTDCMNVEWQNSFRDLVAKEVAADRTANSEEG
jgi:hypothetical protein